MKINEKQIMELRKALSEADESVAAIEFKQESHTPRPSSLFINYLNRTGKIVKVEKIRPDGTRWDKMFMEKS